MPDRLQTGREPLTCMRGDRLGPAATMKLLQEREDERKLIKSQVEKRRRERMNRSLERLKTMLLKEPQPLAGTQRRMEKAEILEHTVLFLQNTAERGQTRSFQDGISTCLQRAAQFLQGPDGRGLWLPAALDPSPAARFSRPDSGSERRTEALGSRPQTLRQKSGTRQHAGAPGGDSFVRPGPVPVEQGVPRIPQPAQKQHHLEVRVERRASKQSPARSHPVSQTLWRPWP